ncbi:MAG: hypothetical protein LCH52_14360 [Bacteroidetes bacterium]|nr:hypothetical protein [Bacteroidota bacterium]
MPQDQLARFLDEQYVISDLPYLEIGDSIVLSGITYKIIESFYDIDFLPDGFYYKASNSDNEYFLIKLLFKFRNVANEPKAVVHSGLTGLSHESLAVPVEFGTGIKKYNFKYCFEIYELPGDVVPLVNVDIAAGAVRNGLLPQVKNLLEYLHENDFYLPHLHLCNLFVSPGKSPRIVLFGYGHALMKSKFPFIAKTSFSEGNLCRYYYSPEIIEGLYSETSDYYSVGMILLRLFYPETFDSAAYRSIVRNGEELKPVIDYKTDLYEVNTIIEGLTLHEELNRFSSKEIEDLIAGKRVVPLYYGSFFLFKDDFGEGKLHNLGDFVELVKSEPERFLAFSKAPQNLKALSDWFNGLEGVKDIAGLKKRIIRYQNITPKYFIEVILRHLLPTKNLILNEIEFDFSDKTEIEKNLQIYFRNLEHIHYYFPTHDIRAELFYFLLAASEISESDPTGYKLLRDARDTVCSILEINPVGLIDSFSTPSMTVFPAQWARIFHAFIPKKYFRSFEGTKIQNLEDFAFYLAQHPEVLTDEFHYYDMIRFLENFGITDLKGRTYKEIVFEIMDKKVECDINISRIDEIEAGKYKMYFSYRYSLTNFFKSHGLELPFTTEIKQQYNYEFKKKGLKSASQTVKHFFSHLEKEFSVKIEKITEEKKSEIANRFNEILATKIRWQTVLVNILIIAGTGFLISEFGSGLVLNEKMKWYLNLMPDFEFFAIKLLPYIVMTGFVGMLYVLSQNLKLIGFIVFTLLLATGGATWFVYEKGSKAIEEDVSLKKSILTELYTGRSAETKPEVISPKEMAALFDITFGIVNPGYKPLVQYLADQERFRVKSNSRVVSRTLRKLQDDSWAAKFDLIDNFSLPIERTVGTVPIPDNNGFFNSLGYFGFKLKMDKIKIEGGDNSVFGIAFNRYYLLITKSEVKLYKKEEENKGDKNEFLLLSQMTGYDYSIEASGPDREVMPAGVLEKLFTEKELVKGNPEINNSEFDLEITVLFSSISVRINGKEVIKTNEKNGYTDLDYEHFKPNISLVFGVESDYSFTSVTISPLPDPTGDRNYLARHNLKGKIKPGSSLFTDKGLSSASAEKPTDKEILFVKNLEGNVVTLESSAGKVFYLSKKDVDDIYF